MPPHLSWTPTLCGRCGLQIHKETIFGSHIHGRSAKLSSSNKKTVNIRWRARRAEASSRAPKSQLRTKAWIFSASPQARGLGQRQLGRARPGLARPAPGWTWRHAGRGWPPVGSRGAWGARAAGRASLGTRTPPPPPRPRLRRPGGPGGPAGLARRARSRAGRGGGGGRGRLRGATAEARGRLRAVDTRTHTRVPAPRLSHLVM